MESKEEGLGGNEKTVEHKQYSYNSIIVPMSHRHNYGIVYCLCSTKHTSVLQHNTSHHRLLSPHIKVLAVVVASASSL